MTKPVHKRHKHLHPALSYAFLLGAGMVSISSTLNIARPEKDFTAAPAIFAAAAEHIAPAPDLASLKTSAAEFSAQLTVIKAQVSELTELGYPPPQGLTDAIGQGEQLVAMISKASSLGELEGMNAGSRLESIGAAIRANSRY